jgi:ribonuclease D
MDSSGGSWEIVATAEELRRVLSSCAHAARVALDLEASGMFTYRARPCTLQLAWDDGRRVAVVDVLSAPLPLVDELLGGGGPIKIVHDVAFDARLLAECGTPLANVHDTAIAARMLGRKATGLASLLETELGVRIGKELQQHDWRTRPLDSGMVSYLVSDVVHLERLESALWRQVTERAIEREVLEETAYRLASAKSAAGTPSTEPPYMRIRGIERLSERQLATLRAVAALREQEAARRDVPPHMVAPNEALLSIARTRAATEEDLARVRGISTATPAARAFVAELARAVASAGERIPDDDRALLERPRVPAAILRTRREREARLMKWRREEAARRAVDEQVVLPGHCVKDAAEYGASSVEDLVRIAGIGAFRIERDGTAIVGALCGERDLG